MPHTIRYRRRSLVALTASVALAAAAAGCDRSPAPTQPPTQRLTPAAPGRSGPTLRVVSGNQQSATVAGRLPQPLVVQVLDSTGRPVAGAPIEWTAASGNGTLDARTGATDTAGLAQVGWVLGAQPKVDTARAATPGVPSPALFVATAEPLPAGLRVVRIEVSPARLGTVVGDTVPLSVVGRDQMGYLRSASVRWSVEGDAITLEPTGASSAVARTVKLGAATVRASLDGDPAVAREAQFMVGSGGDFTALEASTLHGCALTSAGVAYCWGQNFNGYLGTETTDDCFSTPCNLTPHRVTGGLTFAAIEGGATHVCGLTAAGAAYCWGGENLFGQLGSPTVRGPLTPVMPRPVTGGLAFASLALGDYYTCGLTKAGAAYCWGDNYAGQLGTGGSGSGKFEPAPTPVVGGLTFTEISTGYQHACGLTRAGEAYCWGAGGTGALGTGAVGAGADRPTPVAVQTSARFAHISAGDGATCAVTAAGEAYCWGLGREGSLGGGTFDLANSPTPTAVVGGRVFTRVLTSGGLTCGLTPPGAAYCWGLLPGGAGKAAVPTAVPGALTFINLAVPGNHVCGLTAAKRVYCWGVGDFGQLGTGRRQDSPSPKPVSTPW